MTQTGRKRAAALENKGASASSVDAHGGWSRGSRNGAYANNCIPWEAVRCTAGFGPEANRYFVPRANVEPPNELVELVFPDFFAEKEKFKKSDDRMDLAGTFFYLNT